MRILAFSDLHCDTDAALTVLNESVNADVVVGAGDFGIRAERTLEIFNILEAISKPLLVVSGNHDSLPQLKSYCDLTGNIRLLDANAHTIQGVTFYGLGGEIPSRSDASWNETLSEEEAAVLLTAAPKHQVLLTHTPPLDYCDLQKDGSHEGSAAIMDAIMQHAPTLCLCGHIHHSWGSIEQVGDTTVHNLGPSANWYVL